MGSGSQSGGQESLFYSNGHCVLRIKWAMYQKKKKIIPESFGILNSKFNQYSCCRLQLSLTLITCGFSSVGKNGVGKARDSVTPHSLHCLCLYIGKAWAEQWMDSSVSCGENDLILQTKNGTCELKKLSNYLYPVDVFQTQFLVAEYFASLRLWLPEIFCVHNKKLITYPSEG